MKSATYRRFTWSDRIFRWFVGIVAFSSVITIFLIFIFVGWESLPIFLSPEVIEEAGLSKLFLPQLFHGYESSQYIWQPNSDYPKFSLMILFVGSLKVTLVAILFASPLAILSAIYTARFAKRAVREFIKPIIELLAGIPSVVLGFFALMILATVFQDVFGFLFRLNNFVAGIALGVAVIPIIYTISEDALSTVPKSYLEASLALGATEIQTIWRVIMPAVFPGISAAIILGFGRAIGETMIVLMASGNASILSFDFTEPIRSVAATIAAETGEVIFGGTHYSVLFFLGLFLFSFTFLLNYIGDVVVHRFKRKILNVR